MITEAAVFLRDEVRRYLVQDQVIVNAADVVLGNVATLEENQAQLANKVVMTLVQCGGRKHAEERALFHTRNTPTNGIRDRVTRRFTSIYTFYLARHYLRWLMITLIKTHYKG